MKHNALAYSLIAGHTKQRMPIYPDNQFLTPKQVAARIGVSANTLCQWRHRKQGPPFIKRVSRVYYAAPLLEDWYRNGDPIAWPSRPLSHEAN